MTTVMHKNRSTFNGDDTKYNQALQNTFKNNVISVLLVKIQLISTTRQVMFWNISLRNLQMRGPSANEKQV
jgi:hypothetical protein